MKRGIALDRSLVDPSSRRIESLERRLFLKGSLSLGAVAMLSGCELTEDENVQKVLSAMSRWNDRVQAALFDPAKLAPIYPDSMAQYPFRFNAFYGKDDIPEVDAASYRLELSGMIRDTRPWTLEALNALPQASQVTRLICVEGWSAIGKWGGVPFRTFLERVGADLSARYVGFKCADDYYSSIDMATALHPQTLLALRLGEQTLPPENGFPIKLRIPTKLGFKNPKHVMAIFVTNVFPGGYWEDKGYNWFSGS